MKKTMGERWHSRAGEYSPAVRKALEYLGVDNEKIAKEGRLPDVFLTGQPMKAWSEVLESSTGSSYRDTYLFQLDGSFIKETDSAYIKPVGGYGCSASKVKSGIIIGKGSSGFRGIDVVVVDQALPRVRLVLNCVSYCDD